MLVVFGCMVRYFLCRPDHWSRSEKAVLPLNVKAHFCDVHSSFVTSRSMLRSCDFSARSTSVPLHSTHSVNANVSEISLLFSIVIVNVLQLHGNVG